MPVEGDSVKTFLSKYIQVKYIKQLYHILKYSYSFKDP